MERYIIQGRQAGNKIEEFNSLQEAQNKLQEYEYNADYFKTLYRILENI